MQGTLLFHGYYKHRSGGRDIDRPSELWLSTSSEGEMTARASFPDMGATETVKAAKDRRLLSHQVVGEAAGNRPGYEVFLEFEDGRALLTRRGLREDRKRTPLTVPPGTWFDPNTRPDAYCAANLLLRGFALKQGEEKEFHVFDWDDRGQGLVDYSIRLKHTGRERIEVPAGAFDANHLVLTQLTTAKTWFKKGANHVTHYWVLDNDVIVRVLRQREPYEMVLLSATFPAKLPGHLAPADGSSKSNNVAAAGGGTTQGSKYEGDWTAFAREVDQTYPFFELKGIRGDWETTRQRLSAKVKSCGSDAEFLGVIGEAIRCLRDAHMEVGESKAAPTDEPRLYYPGFSLMPATGARVIVMAASSQYAQLLSPGMIVTRIDGRDARTVMEEKGKEAWSAATPYHVSSPQRARFFAYRFPLAGARDAAHTLNYLVHGAERSLSARCDVEVRGWPHTYNRPTNLVSSGRTVVHAGLGSGAGYMCLRSVSDETEQEMTRALGALPAAQGWIVDLRGNGGGGYDDRLLERLKTLPRPVVVLIDAGCISAGETLARDLAAYSGARLMGATTAGSSTSKRTWSLPSGLASVRFSTRSRWRQDGQPIEYHGIAPDTEVEAVPEEVAKGLNSEILRAEEYLRQARVSSSPQNPKP
jgi:hypothetical protein